MALTPIQQEARKKLGYGAKQILSPQEIQKVNQEVVRLSRRAKGLTTPTATAPPVAPPTAPPMAPPSLTQRDPARDKRTREKMGRDPLTPQEQDLYDRMTYTPEEIKALGLGKPPQTGLPPLYNPDVLKAQGFSPEQMGALAPAGQQANAAAMGLSSTQRPTNSALRILQDALNAKSSVVNQPLGGSNLFQQGGLQTTGSLGYSLLAQNLAQRSQEMGDKYNSFKTTVGDVATGMTDTYNLALDQYKLAKDAYDTQVAQLTKINEAAQEQERALGLLDRQNKLQKEMEEYKAQLNLKYAKPPQTPTHDDWLLAGGKEGTGMTYAEFYKDIKEKVSIKAPEVKQFGDDYKQWDDSTQTWKSVRLENIPSSAKTDKAREVIAKIDRLLSDEDVLGNAVGPISSRILTLRGESADFELEYESLKSLLTLENMGIMKGVLSDADIKILKEASTGGLDIRGSEAGFKAKLNEIKEKMQTVLRRVGEMSPTFENPEEALKVFYQSADFDAQVEIMQLKAQGLTDEQVLKEKGQPFRGSADVYNPAKAEVDVDKLSNGPTKLSMGEGTVTGIDGSSLWRWGLDFVLKGGVGATVTSPFAGKVIAAKANKGFGNQVKIALQNGDELWLSHLNKINVQEGDVIDGGTSIGQQGNTGSVLGGKGEKLKQKDIAGGRGTHVDITIKKKDGSFYTAREVAAILNDKRLSNLA